jgi:DNA-binding transcriptional LysR family regulator
MDIRNMRQLVAIQSHGSFAKAARALSMSQPSLSGAMARLEDQLKVRLFERSARGSQLTPVGELMAERARRVIAETEQMVRDAALVAGGEAGELRVGLGSYLVQNFLPRFVRGLAENHPLLSLNIDVLHRSRLVPLLKSRELDLIICAMGDDVVAPDLVATEVFITRAVVVARPDHPLANERQVSMERLADFPAAGSSNNAALLGWPPDRGQPLQYQSSAAEPLIELALSGRATLICPLFVAQPYLADGRLKRIDAVLDFKVSYAAMSTRASSTSPIINRVVRLATSIGEAMQAEAGAL